MNAMRPRFLLLPAVLLAALAAAAQARADTTTVPGDQLVVTSTLSEDVLIGTDPSLSGQVRVTLDGSLSCLSIVGGHVAVIGTSGCSDEAGKLRIDVSPDTPVSITSHSDGDIHVRDLHSPLVAALYSSGDLTTGHVGSLTVTIHGSGDVTSGEVSGPATIEIAGSGDVRIKQVSGPLNSRQIGSGDLVIGAIESDAASLEATGSGDALIGSGHIGNLHGRFSGSSDLAVAATVGNADVEAFGGSDIKLGHVTGTLTKHASGGSDIIVGGSSTIDHIISQVARNIGNADPEMHARYTSRSSGFGHFLTFAFVLLVLYISFRIIKRGGGLGGLRTTFRSGPPPGPSHPGVLALCERMTQLDQRLGRLEGYVTTREFDLNRKFRELGR
jgi:hypothetical protein